MAFQPSSPSSDDTDDAVVVSESCRAFHRFALVLPVPDAGFPQAAGTRVLFPVSCQRTVIPFAVFLARRPLLQQNPVLSA